MQRKIRRGCAGDRSGLFGFELLDFFGVGINSHFFLHRSDEVEEEPAAVAVSLAVAARVIEDAAELGMLTGDQQRTGNFFFLLIQPLKLAFAFSTQNELMWLPVCIAYFPDRHFLDIAQLRQFGGDFRFDFEVVCPS